jgi:hypothetical protein
MDTGLLPTTSWLDLHFQADEFFCSPDIFVSFCSKHVMAFTNTKMAALGSDYSHEYDVNSEAT